MAGGNIPGHIADYYLSSGDAKDTRRGATSRRASLRLLQPLVFHADPRVRMEKVLGAGAPDTIWQFVRDDVLSAEDFALLVDHKDEEIHYLSARNGALSEEDFERLLTDAASVVKGLGENTKLTKAQRARARDAGKG